MFSRSSRNRKKVAVVKNATVTVLKPEQKKEEPALDLRKMKKTVRKPKQEKKVKIIVKEKGED